MAFPRTGSGDTPTGRRPAYLVIAGLAIAAILAIGWYGYHQSITPDGNQVRTATENAAYELERTPIKGLGVYSFTVSEALYQGNRGGRYGNVSNYLRAVARPQAT